MLELGRDTEGSCFELRVTGFELRYLNPRPITQNP